MADQSKKKPARVGIVWDVQFDVPDDTFVGVVEVSHPSKAVAGGNLIREAHRYPDRSSLKTLARPLTALDYEKQAALAYIGAQIVGLMPLEFVTETAESLTDEYALIVSRSGTTYTFRLEYPTAAGGGSDGEDGEDGASVELRVEGGFIQWRQDDDSPTWTNLVDLATLKGEDGEDGEDGAPGSPGAPGEPGEPGADGEDCGCNQAPTKPPEDEGDNFKCGAAIAVTKRLHAIFDQVHADSAGLIAGVGAGTTTIAGVVAFLFPAVAIVAGSIGALVAIMSAILSLDAGQVADFNETVEETYRCMLYCLMGDDANLTPEILEQWADLIEADTNFVSSYVHALLRTIPFDDLQWAAWAASEVSAEACDCDCEEEPTGSCDDPENWEFGTVTSIDVDEMTGNVIVVVESAVVGGVNTARWGSFETSAPTGCKIISIGLDPNWEEDSYARVVGSPGGAATGPVNFATLDTGEDGLCYNFFQQNAPTPFTMTIIFSGCE